MPGQLLHIAVAADSTNTAGTAPAAVADNTAASAGHTRPAPAVWAWAVVSCRRYSGARPSSPGNTRPQFWRRLAGPESAVAADQSRKSECRCYCRHQPAGSSSAMGCRPGRSRWVRLVVRCCSLAAVAADRTAASDTGPGNTAGIVRIAFGVVENRIAGGSAAVVADQSSLVRRDDCRQSK